MHSVGLTYEILNLESLRPMKSPAPRLCQAASLAYTCCVLSPRVLTQVLSLFTLYGRSLFSFGELDGQKINEVTPAHWFSLALSTIAVISLMEQDGKEHTSKELVPEVPALWSKPCHFPVYLKE